LRASADFIRQHLHPAVVSAHSEMLRSRERCQSLVALEVALVLTTTLPGRPLGRTGRDFLAYSLPYFHILLLY
jgi:hypothetical protein